MVCIKCGSKTRVFNSRAQKKVNQVWRRRECLKCGTQFTTHEGPDYSTVWVVKGKNNRLEAFSSNKLLLSLHRSLGHRQGALKDAGSLSQTITTKLLSQDHQGLITTGLITNLALVALNRFDRAAAVHYEAFHKASIS